MAHSRRQNIQEVLVFMLLIGIGVVGRLGQPTWEFTPVAAAAVFAGFYFSQFAIAALIPLATLAISDLILPAHSNVPVMLATYGSMTLPVWFGRLLRTRGGGWDTAARWVLCGLVPAVVFFVVTNFAVWAFQSDYEGSLAGLAECYWRAVPFFRAMLTGDVFYMAILFGCWTLAGLGVTNASQRVEIRAR